MRLPATALQLSTPFAAQIDGSQVMQPPVICSASSPAAFCLLVWAGGASRPHSSEGEHCHGNDLNTLVVLTGSRANRCEHRPRPRLDRRPPCPFGTRAPALRTL